ncbi:MAG: hypothetical protein HY908_26140 [Myxococcales bacterium]|nr:hypothetical protein [Myxococcales bacterium]MCC6522210.1 hypothetical protein [Polyangiaceae bacterium]
MPAKIVSSGEIETICDASGLTSGGTAKLVFRAFDDASPPFTIKVRAPGGKVILDRVVRELPTGRPQSAPPVTFAVAAAGQYRIEITQLYGGASGQATLDVS